ncbi:peptidylprolyl isomerase [uncultured Thiothrix sp.]|uniref:peptidylprolyl isomerase n=1 Tax=uncultured Thiothrix sp. TaxID=223185 RepID=UPI002617DC46|nr:peptidylprolyl isomerase [uncultured Thiothrix sp.]HMT92313.1 peptidylprolyl isomerase [Thiolinea sp.]
MRIITNTLIASSLIGLVLGLNTVSAEDTKPAAAATTTAAPAMAAPAASTEAKPAGADEIVAIVNGVDIKRDTLNTLMDMAKRSGAGDQVDEKTMLEDLVVTELARQEANKSGLAEREDVQEKLNNFKDKLVLNTWMQEKAAALNISDDELKAAYDKATSQMSKSEYKARHILVKTKDEAKAVLDELKAGKDFADLAKAKSTDTSAQMGGDLGWFKTDSMVKPFAEAVAAMEPGQTSTEPVETQFGWHVIKLEEKRDVKLPELENMKPQLKRQIEQEKMMAYMKDLRAKADVKVLLKEEAKPTAEAPKEEAKEATPAAAAEPAKTQ